MFRHHEVKLNLCWDHLKKNRNVRIFIETMRKIIYFMTKILYTESATMSDFNHTTYYHTSNMIQIKINNIIQFKTYGFKNTVRHM